MKRLFDKLFKLTRSLINYSQSLSKTVLLAYCVLLIALLGVIDYFTTPDFTFSVFYLIPISIAAWLAGKKAGLTTSFLCALTAYGVHLLWPKDVSNEMVQYWDALTDLTFFSITALILARLRYTLLHERSVARTDYLTGISNARYFYEISEKELKRADRLRSFITMVYIDLDNFKDINDNLGHMKGDSVLRIAAETLKNTVRDIDTVARIGGDEFVILMPDTNFEESSSALRRIKSALDGALSCDKWKVTASLGATTCPGQDCSVDTLITLADRLMYEVKANGKDNVIHKNIDEVSSCRLPTVSRT